MAKAGGSPEVVASSPAAFGALVLSGEYVYWGAMGAVYRVSKSGGVPAKVTDAPSPFDRKPQAIEIAGQSVYFDAEVDTPGPDGGAFVGGVWAAGAGTDASPKEVFHTAHWLRDFVVRGDDCWMIDLDIAAERGTLLDGSLAHAIVEPVIDVEQVGIVDADERDVYWSTGFGRRLSRSSFVDVTVTFLSRDSMREPPPLAVRLGRDLGDASSEARTLSAPFPRAAGRRAC